MKEYEQKIDALGELYLVKKAPFQIPDKFKEIIVKYGPYLSALILILSLPGILTLFSLTTVLSPFAQMAGVRYGPVYMLNGLLALIGLVVSAISIPGLLKRKLSGWRLAWYASLISQVENLLSLQLLSLILGLLISMYCLYQIKSYYK